MIQDIAEQSRVEATVLKHLTEGLRATIGWQVQSNDCSRKLSTLRFNVWSFQQHLERLFTLEEYGGYMAIEIRKSPRLIKAVDELKVGHEMFRTGIRRIVHRLEQISGTDGVALNTLGDELSVLLQQLDEHNRKEVDLIQESFERDQGGGEG
jgi:hypothetical protein